MVTLNSRQSPLLKLECIGKHCDESCLSQWKSGLSSCARTAGVGSVSLPHQESWSGHWMGMTQCHRRQASLQCGFQICMGIYLTFRWYLWHLRDSLGVLPLSLGLRLEWELWASEEVVMSILDLEAHLELSVLSWELEMETWKCPFWIFRKSQEMPDFSLVAGNFRITLSWIS